MLVWDSRCAGIAVRVCDVIESLARQDRALRVVACASASMLVVVMTILVAS